MMILAEKSVLPRVINRVNSHNIPSYLKHQTISSR